MSKIVKKTNEAKKEVRYFSEKYPYIQVERTGTFIMTMHLKDAVTNKKYAELKRKYGAIIDLDNILVEVTATPQNYEGRKIVVIRYGTSFVGHRYLAMGIAVQKEDDVGVAIYDLLPDILENKVDWHMVLDDIVSSYLDDEEE